MSAGTGQDERRRTPRATYRLQFHKGFTLRDALALTPYLAELGVSHIYASPLLKARPGSTHGYDVCNPGELNPELGSEADLAELVRALKEKGMGLVLDIVPNHMGIGGRENPWWWDALKHGQKSWHAGHFDIDWNSRDPRLRRKVLAPVLGSRYEEVLAKGELKVSMEDGEAVLRYYDNVFPIDPETLPEEQRAEDYFKSIQGDPRGLDELIQRQHYRLTFWRHGDKELNYRRFFSITTLAGVRVEFKEIFENTHERILDWYRRGYLDGLRVDHPDGLRDPEGYLRRLREAAPEAWIVVEKILEPGEKLPAEWPIEGTTGYDFMSRAGGLLIDPEGEAPLSRFYEEFTGEPGRCEAIVREKKLSILREVLAAEVNRLADLLVEIATDNWDFRDFSREELREGLIEFAACFPVYRTYVQAKERRLDFAGMQWIETAAGAARRNRPDLPESLFALFQKLLLLELSGPFEVEFVMRFQQLTGPAMAKGVEDTTFYCFNRMLALNEVGGDPAHFGLGVEKFHRITGEFAKAWPQSMLGTSTHDTKRSEDVRARLSLISEMPEEWAAAVKRWSGINEKHRQGRWPDRNAEYSYYQNLVGAWPISAERAAAFMEKASREAKQHTNWTDADPEYDKALREFVERTLADREFTAEIEKFTARLLVPGRVNSLALTLLKLAAPGVPDIYQGTEFWDLSLVDPDNRRPVDYEARRKALEGLMAEFGGNAGEGGWQHLIETEHAKQFLIWRVLQFRAAHPEPFEKGDYRPLKAEGPKAKHIVAFAREHHGERILAAVPRLAVGLGSGGGEWDGTAILPDSAGGEWENVITGKPLGGAGKLAAAPLFEHFPVALLFQRG